MRSYLQLSKQLEVTRLRFEERLMQMEQSLRRNLPVPDGPDGAPPPSRREILSRSEKQLAALLAKRKKSARFWKAWKKDYRTSRRLLRSLILQHEDDAKQIERLTADLNLALEVNEQLRKELGRPGTQNG